MADYQPYSYGSVAYKQDSYAHDEWAPKRQPTRRVDVIPGGAKGRAAEVSPAAAFASKVAKVTVAVVLVFAGVGFGRISLSAATVAEALEARTVSNQLEDARSAINELEVTQSSLANPTRIKNEATALGMGNPAEAIVLDLSGDVVATDGDGRLSLTGSMAVMQENQEKAAAEAAAAQAAAQQATAQQAAAEAPAAPPQGASQPATSATSATAEGQPTPSAA